MSEPFVISDTERHAKKTTISLSSSSSTIMKGTDAFKSIGGLSPGRVEQYMQQFSSNSRPLAANSNNNNRRNASNSGTRNKKSKGFKRKFKKKRIQTLTTSGTTSRENQTRNYYNDDPGFTASDFSLQWEGTSRVTLD